MAINYPTFHAMTVSDALHGVVRLGLDTAPIIYYIEQVPSFFPLCYPVFTAIDEGTLDAFTSTLSLPETLVHSLRNGDSQGAKAFHDLLLRTAGILSIPVSVEIGERSADLRAHYNLRTPDAIQIATALELGCDAFLTNDTKLQRVTEINVLVLQQLTV